MATVFSRLANSGRLAPGEQSNHLAAPALPDDGPVPQLLGHESAQQQAMAPVWRNSFEYSEWFTIGGVSGTYRFECPYDSLCEVNVITFTASDQASATFSISDAITLANTTTIVAGTAQSRGLMPFWTAAATQFPLTDCWMPLYGKPTLVFQTTVAAAHAAWITFQFRRRINAMNVYTVSER